MFAIARSTHTQCGRPTKASWAALAFAACSVALFVSASDSSAAPRQQPRIKPPPSVELTYSIKAQQSGLNVKGDAVLNWTASGNSYSIEGETNAAMFGKILETHSEGRIEPNGLSPTRFTEKRYRKKEAVTLFDRSERSISFSESGESLPLQAGTQDRTSVVWQLISVARAAPAGFKAGSEWVMPVAGRRRVEPWTFKVIQNETIQTPMGTLEALHVQKSSDSHRDQEVDLWLAPSLQWYPVKIRYSDRGGMTIEQTLKSVK